MTEKVCSKCSFLQLFPEILIYRYIWIFNCMTQQILIQVVYGPDTVKSWKLPERITEKTYMEENTVDYSNVIYITL